MRSRRWILWLFLIVGALVTLSAASVYMLVRGLQLAPASVVTGSTLTLDMRGPLPEDRLFDLSSPFIDVETVTFKDVLDSVERAKDDSRVDSLLVHFRGTGIGWAKAEEIRSALLDFNGSGKKLVSYLEYGGTLDYYLASAADTIHIHPQSILDLRGLNAEVTFMKSTLDKLGIEAEFEQIGAYKNAPDVYTRESLSGPHREALAAIVDDLYDRLVDSIATSRNLSVREVEAIFDRGPFRAGEAQELGLVDELLYKDEVETLLTETGGEFHSLSVAGYQASGDDGLSLDGRHTIALIYGVGVIVGGQSDEDPFFGRIMGADTLAATFKQVREDDSIEAVVFRIQSPGGSDVASDVIWREASLTMEEKPVVVSMADVAASGGYWIATASNAIVAEPSTITGSIGIYAGKFNLDGLFEKIGFSKDRVMRGQSADFWSDSRSFTREERLRLRGILDEGYARFLEKVAASRNMEPEEVDAIGQGRVWTGAQALEIGLVDELGGLDRAVALAREKANIPEGAKIRLEIYPERGTFFEMLWKKMTHGTPEVVGIRRWIPERLLDESPVLRLLTEKPRLALMPFDMKIH
jgi:protease-4